MLSRNSLHSSKKTTETELVPVKLPRSPEAFTEKYILANLEASYLQHPDRLILALNTLKSKLVPNEDSNWMLYNDFLSEALRMLAKKDVMCILTEQIPAEESSRSILLKDGIFQEALLEKGLIASETAIDVLIAERLAYEQSNLKNLLSLAETYKKKAEASMMLEVDTSASADFWPKEKRETNIAKSGIFGQNRHQVDILLARQSVLAELQQGFVALV